MSDETFDVIVIGGGVGGLSAAGALSVDARVLVLEGEEAIGYHTSGRSAALYEESYGKPAVTALNRASRPHLDAGGYLTPRGLMLLGTADNTEAFDADMDAMLMAPLTRDEMLARVPVLNPRVITRGGWHEAALDIDTDRLLQDFAKAVRAGGGEVRTRAPVSAIRHEGGSWHVTHGRDAREASAPVLINAGGAWADVLAGMAGVPPLGLTPLRRSIARIPAPADHDVTAWPMIFGAGETWYAKPDAGALLVSPADEDPQEPHDAWPDDMVLAEGIARYEAHVTEPVTRLLASWAGLRTFSPDRVPVLGEDRRSPGFFWAAGQGGYGFQTSMAAGRLVADLVLGRSAEIPAELRAALSPARFA